MKHATAQLALMFFATTGFAVAQPEQKSPVAEQKPIRVLIVTGTDWKGHLWKETGPALRGVLEADPRVDARIAEDPGFLAADAIFGFRTIALMFKNYGPVAQEEKARANLLRFVEGGGGLAVVHYGSGAFEDWPEYRGLIGRAQQKRHDPRGPFWVRIVDREHPVTAGMSDFETDDELFFELQGDAPIRVLALAHSKVTGQDHPMAFVLQRGKGRVFHTTLGHDAKAIGIPGAAELMRRGIIWAAIGDAPAPSRALSATRRRLEAALEQWREESDDPLLDSDRLQRWIAASDTWGAGPHRPRGKKMVVHVPPGGLELLR